MSLAEQIRSWAKASTRPGQLAAMEKIADQVAELEAANADLQQRLDLAVAAWHSERDSYRILRDAAEVQS